MRLPNIWFPGRPSRRPGYGPSRGFMYDLIFDRLAAMRAAAEARAQRIQERSTALEARRRGLRARIDALRHQTIASVEEPAETRPGAEPLVPVLAA